MVDERAQHRQSLLLLLAIVINEDLREKKEKRKVTYCLLEKEK